MYEPGVAQHHLCNIQVGDWNCVNKSRIRITIILISLLAITIISKVLLLMCVMTWCYRHFRKPEQTCARQLDPDDPSIVLCEDLDNLDKCLCFDIKNQKPKGRNLHEQTVNVSYYPFASSPFSSGKTSSKSSGKYSSRTDHTNTTTSAAISFAEDEETTEETDNTNKTLYCDDEVSNQVAYGVYCGIADDEEEEESESSASDKRSGKSSN